VPGNFHISSHTNQEAYQKLFYSTFSVPMKHTINAMSFGRMDDLETIRRKYGIYMNNELDGTSVMA